MEDNKCACGHLYDEHITEEPFAPCEVEGCPCKAFDWVPTEPPEEKP